MSTVLVVDDNQLNLKVSSLLLKQEGFHVLSAANASDALRLVRTAHPEVVLLDLQMPGTDGFEVARQIRNDPDVKNIRIIAITAYATEDSRRRATESGCDAYITKPIDTRSVPDLIRAQLASRT